MGEWREVAARADRASARHLGNHATAETVEQQLRDLEPSPRVALRKRIRAHEHRRPHDLVRVRLADAARVAAEQAHLQLLGQLARYPSRDEAAEAGGHAVGRFIPSERLVHDCASRGHLLAGAFVELRACRSDRHVPDIGNGEVLTRQADHGRPGHGGESSLHSRDGRPGQPRAGDCASR